VASGASWPDDPAERRAAETMMNAITALAIVTATTISTCASRGRIGVRSVAVGADIIVPSPGPVVDSAELSVGRE
jgi:hypothetical protein